MADVHGGRSALAFIWRDAKRVVGPAARQLRQALDRRRKIHFLHIGKNAGSQVGLVAAQVNQHSDRVRIVVQGHGVRLLDLPPSHDYFFSIRDPIGRFVSGFYSRKRKGQPRIYVEWTEDEAAAFARFDHANDLAEALFQPGPDGQAAFAAIKSIFHTAMDQVSWFERRGQFLEVRPPIAILRQESLTRDLTAFLDVIGCADMPIEVSRDPVSAHSNTYEGIPRLSDRAKDNLRRWYAQDYELYARCCEWIEMRQGG